ncbi:hypothetical protein QE152_g25278 [Popillia japonica]|uniref:Uncharacterized protein n=1 Tax=Popillia japonica TaxID=7064 RepID=A0AAW1K3C7_POPJA
MLTGRMICLRHAIPQSSSLQTLSKEYNTTEGGNPYGNFSNIARNVSKSYGIIQLKEAIRMEISQISLEMLVRATGNFRNRLRQCCNNGGQHFGDILRTN